MEEGASASRKRPGPPGPAGPARPAAASAAKKGRVLEFESVHVAALPCASRYERSFTHAAHVTHCVVTPRTA